MSRAVLLVNLGTPRSPSVQDVRRYLNEFLMDPHVLNLPWPARRLIVSGFILPFRPRRSAAAYASIWGEEGSAAGSPLLRHTEVLGTALDERIDALLRSGHALRRTEHCRGRATAGGWRLYGVAAGAALPAARRLHANHGHRGGAPTPARIHETGCTAPVL